MLQAHHPSTRADSAHSCHNARQEARAPTLVTTRSIRRLRAHHSRAEQPFTLATLRQFSINHAVQNLLELERATARHLKVCALLVEQPKHELFVRKQQLFPAKPRSFLRNFSKAQPLRQRKVDSFRAVKSRREPRVVSARKRHDKVAFRLNHAMDLHARLNQLLRCHHRVEVVEHVLSAREFRLVHASEHALEPGRVALSNSVPYFLPAGVHEVDRVQVVIFRMPAERREQHAKVHPGLAHALEAHVSIAPDESEQRFVSVR
mmetsp:Transcript_10842/g.23090  ORF Transcript_10842/g.23090 Transcript_10842/m.23090 type:complete len:262 (-) Transcript_10842:777-1562(-)